jgi:curved DNA-binding protein CbpA
MTMTPNPPQQLDNKPQPDFTATDPYRILGLPPTADQSAIKRTYFALIRQFPPETEADKFKIIRGAYEKLKDTKRRAETDIFRPQPPPAWQPPSHRQSLDTSFQPADALTVLRNWGELGRTDFQDDFRDVEL